MSKPSKRELQDDVHQAKQAAIKNLRTNSGRDQATFEHAVDVAEKRVKQAES